MLAILSIYDEDEKSIKKEKISFVHINSSNKEDIEKEIKPLALRFARRFKVEKVYCFYGKDEKLIYDYPLQS